MSRPLRMPRLLQGECWSSIAGALLGACLAVAVCQPAAGADWMFEPSYYSHADSPGYTGNAPRSRSAYRPAISNYNPRLAIRGGYRFNNIGIFNGNSYDRTIIRENWFDEDYR